MILALEEKVEEQRVHQLKLLASLNHHILSLFKAFIDFTFEFTRDIFKPTLAHVTFLSTRRKLHARAKIT